MVKYTQTDGQLSNKLLYYKDIQKGFNNRPRSWCYKLGFKECKKSSCNLNTHGHFDHVWSNKELKEKLNIPIYCPKDDEFMLNKDPFGQGTPKVMQILKQMEIESLIQKV